jgi:hypothetical protein
MPLPSQRKSLVEPNEKTLYVPGADWLGVL